MALTIAAADDNFPNDAWGAFKVFVGRVTFDSSYPTGGEAVTAADFGLSKIEAVIPVCTTGGEVVTWNAATSKLMVFTADGTQASNSSNQSAVVADVIVLGR